MKSKFHETLKEFSIVLKLKNNFREILIQFYKIFRTFLKHLWKFCLNIWKPKGNSEQFWESCKLVIMKLGRKFCKYLINFLGKILYQFSQKFLVSFWETLLLLKKTLKLILKNFLINIRKFWRNWNT